MQPTLRTLVFSKAVFKWLSKNQNQSNRVITFNSHLKTVLPSANTNQWNPLSKVSETFVYVSCLLYFLLAIVLQIRDFLIPNGPFSLTGNFRLQSVILQSTIDSIIIVIIIVIIIIIIIIIKGEDYSTTMSWIRVKAWFVLLRSVLLCLRGSRCKQRAPMNITDNDFEIDKELVRF